MLEDADTWATTWTDEARCGATVASGSSITQENASRYRAQQINLICIRKIQRHALNPLPLLLLLPAVAAAAAASAAVASLASRTGFWWVNPPPDVLGQGYDETSQSVLPHKVTWGKNTTTRTGNVSERYRTKRNGAEYLIETNCTRS